MDGDDDDEEELAETAELAERIRTKKRLIVQQHRLAKGANRPMRPRTKGDRPERTLQGLKAQLEEVGVRTGREELQNAKRKRGRSLSPRRRCARTRAAPGQPSWHRGAGVPGLACFLRAGAALGAPAARTCLRPPLRPARRADRTRHTARAGCRTARWTPTSRAA